MFKGKEKKKTQAAPSSTFNDLDERFQLTSEHDPEHVFPEEMHMVEEIRRRRPELNNESDKFILTFLFARRHNVEDALILLDSFVKKRKELGLDVNPPSLSNNTLASMLQEGVEIHYRHCVDKHNRIVYYIWLHKNPKDRPLETLYLYNFWDTYYNIQNESLSTLRNGCILVIDMTNFGWNNIDLSSKGKEYVKSMTGLFPKRIRAVIPFNGGLLIRGIIQAAKVIVPGKLMKRVHTIYGKPDEELKQIIDEENLLVEYGGKCALTVNDLIAQIREFEETQKQKEKEKDKLKTLNSSSETPGLEGATVDA